MTNKLKIILDTVSGYYGITMGELRGHHRYSRVVWPRQLCMALGSAYKLPHKEIASALRRHRTLISYSYRIVMRRKETEPKRRVEIERIIKRIKENETWRVW
jgi:chromosomal replication initiation ATPase DnaA